MLTYLAVAAAAEPPQTEAQVQALLRQLLAPEAADRVAAANALSKTPPPLVAHLQVGSIDATCYSHVSRADLDGAPEACLRWNHAMYHFVRVVAALGRQSVDPSTALGTYCVARTQPHPGDLVEKPACDLGATLRWMVNDPFEEHELIGPEATHGGKPVDLPDLVSRSALEKTAREGWIAMLGAAPKDAADLARRQPFTAERDGVRFSVLPVCGGRSSPRELCAFHLSVGSDEKLATTTLLPPLEPGGDNPAGMPYAPFRDVHAVHVLVAEGGRHGALVTDYGGFEDDTRRIDVYDLTSAPRHHCHVELELGVERGSPVPAPKLPTITADGCRP